MNFYELPQIFAQSGFYRFVVVCADFLNVKF